MAVLCLQQPVGYSYAVGTSHSSEEHIYEQCERCDSDLYEELDECAAAFASSASPRAAAFTSNSAVRPPLPSAFPRAPHCDAPTSCCCTECSVAFAILRQSGVFEYESPKST